MTDQLAPPAEEPTHLGTEPGNAGYTIAALIVGAAVSVGLGVYGRVHSPTGQSAFTLGFANGIAMKVWLSTAAAALALAQVLSAAAMFGRLGSKLGSSPWTAPVHRWSGTAAFVCTLPVAFHCLWSLGFQPATPRVLAHSALGSAFYGVFVAKMMLLRRSGLRGWVIPAIGSALVAILLATWAVSAGWFLTTFGTP